MEDIKKLLQEQNELIKEQNAILKAGLISLCESGAAIAFCQARQISKGSSKECVSAVQPAIDQATKIFQERLQLP